MNFIILLYFKIKYFSFNYPTFNHKNFHISIEIIWLNFNFKLIIILNFIYPFLNLLIIIQDQIFLNAKILFYLCFQLIKLLTLFLIQ